MNLTLIVRGGVGFFNMVIFLGRGSTGDTFKNITTFEIDYDIFFFNFILCSTNFT